VADEEQTLDEQLAELLKAGQFTVTGEQPKLYPGFIQRGTPEAPYFEPDPSFRPPLVQAEPVSITGFGPDEVPITPQVQTQAEGQKQEEELTKNIEESLDPFAISAHKLRTGVRPELGRQEDDALGKIGGAGKSALEFLDELAKGAFAEAGKAAAGEEFNPQKVADPAQLALPVKGALLVGGGLLAGGMAAKKLQESPYSPEDLAKLLIPSAGAAEMTNEEKLIAAARQRLAPQEQPPAAVEGQPAPGTAPPVGARAPRKPRLPIQGSKESDEKFSDRMNAYDAALEKYEVDKKKFYSTFTPTAQRIINTVGGPKVVRDADFTGLGTLAAISAGMIMAPRIARAFKWGVTPRPRSFMDALTLKEGVFGEQFTPTGRVVQNAMPGTLAFSRPSDLLRSADSINQAILNIGAKNGLTPTTQRHLENLFGTYTRGGAQHLVESAVETGKMRTNTFTFDAPVSLAEMQRKFTPEMKQYIAAMDTFEALVAESRLNAYKVSKGNPNPGIPTMAGHDVNTLGPVIRQMELANPEVVQAAKAWKGWNQSVRDFQVKGEYATIPKNQANPMVPDNSAQYMNKYRQYETPWLEGKVNKDMPIGERLAAQDPIQMQSMYSKFDLRKRLENEAIGQYVDAMRKATPGSFVKIDAETLARNPVMQKNTVTFFRRGVKEHYTTDPFIADGLKMDTPIMNNGDILYAAKRALEFGATGPGAPFFSATSFVRNYWIGKMSAEKGFYSPTIAGSVRAIGQQLYPQTAKAIHEALDKGALSRFVDAGWTDSLSKVLAKHYNDSLYFKLKQAGSARGSINEHERMSHGINELARVIKEYSGPAKPFLNGWKNLFESIHNGPAFDYVRRNLQTINPRTGQTITLPDMALKGRQLTGDPRTAGQFYFKEPGPTGKQRMIRYESGPDGLGRLGHQAAYVASWPYLYLSEFGRKAVPWFNPTQQGIKGIGQAYLRDPVQFTRNMWLYAAMPAAANYLYTHSLGKDPNGHSYVDYWRDRRSAYTKQMNFFVPIPGRPAEDGIEVPFFHELAPVKALTEIAMDHMFGNSENSFKDEYWKAAHAFLKTAIYPPVPPAISAPAALFGFQFPQGVFGEQGYTIKNDPFDQYAGMPANIEAFTRALGGGMAQVIGSGYAAFANTPEGFIQGVQNGLSQAGKTGLQKAPLVRDMTGVLPVMSGNTDIREELFEKQKEIDQLIKYFQGDRAGFQINTKPASTGGGNVADILHGEPSINTQPPGLVPPPPTNPIYQQFMADVYNRFKKESPTFVNGKDEGGIGFRSLWRRYGDATQALKTLRSVNDGNNVTWQKQLEGRPELRKELEASHVDPTDLRAVKNYYVYKQQDSARIILKTIKAVEQEFSQKIGKPVTIKDFKPYIPPDQAGEEVPFAYPEVVKEAQDVWQTPQQ
jgi:hypothetical protein